MNVYQDAFLAFYAEQSKLKPILGFDDCKKYISISFKNMTDNFRSKLIEDIRRL